MAPIRALPYVSLLSLALSAAACSRHDAGPSAAPALASAAPKGASPPGSPSSSAVGHKLIKTASLTVSVESPSVALNAARNIAERNGGYLKSVASTGSRDEQDVEEGSVACLKVRVDRFDQALDALRRLGAGRRNESIETQDVGEEYTDLEARLRAQERVEEQYLALLNRAKNVPELLEVHKQLAGVRTEIERLEGRRRLLDDQVMFSTINLTIEKQRPLLAVNAGRFSRALQLAGADVLNVGAGIVLGIVRAAGVLIPLTVLVLLPLALAGRRAARRFSKLRSHPAS